MSDMQAHADWDAQEREAHRERLHQEMKRDSHTMWAEKHIGMAMSLASAEEMVKRGDDSGDEFFEVESAKWDAEYALMQAFGLSEVPTLISRFVQAVVPLYTPTGPRAHQLTLIANGNLRVAIDKLGRLLELPVEYAEPLLEDVVKPFAEVRTM